MLWSILHTTISSWSQEYYNYHVDLRGEGVYGDNINIFSIIIIIIVIIITASSVCPVKGDIKNKNILFFYLSIFSFSNFVILYVDFSNFVSTDGKCCVCEHPSIHWKCQVASSNFLHDKKRLQNHCKMWDIDICWAIRSGSSH